MLYKVPRKVLRKVPYAVLYEVPYKVSAGGPGPRGIHKHTGAYENTCAPEHCQDSLAEWSKALASGASPQGRGLEPHSCHVARTWSPRRFRRLNPLRGRGGGAIRVRLQDENQAGQENVFKHGRAGAGLS